MANLSDFLNLLRPELRGCPDFTIKAHLLRILRDFCAQTWIWEDWQKETKDGDGDTHTVSVDADRELVIVPRVWSEDWDLKPSEFTFPGQDAGYSDYEVSRSFQFDPPDTIRFLFTVADGDVFYPQVVYQPTTDATEFPDFILKYHEDGLSAGTKSRLMMQPGQNWSNPELGQYYQRIYDREVGRAKILKQRQYTATPLRVQPKKFI